MYKVGYKALPLQILLPGEDTWATFRATVIALRKDTAATVTSEFRSRKSSLDRLHVSSIWCYQGKKEP